jgi:Fusaric acid resistance protein-like
MDHVLLVIGLLLGAMVAMVCGFGASMYATARSQLITILFLPLPMLATLALGMALHVRLLSLASLAVILAIGTYCRRYGPRGFSGSTLAFLGAFLGFFIQDDVTLGDFGWLTAEIMLGVVVTLAVHFTCFYPRPAAHVRRMQRSYAARARDVTAELADVYSARVRSGEKKGDDKRLQRELLRFNEAALLIDSRLGNAAAVPPGWSSATLHQRLFDAEVALSNVARFAVALAGRSLPADVTAPVGQALAGIRDADVTAAPDNAAAIRQLLESPAPERSPLTPTDRVLLHRFATSITDSAAALHAFHLYPAGQVPDDEPQSPTPTEGFRTQVATSGGWLPGSSAVAGVASGERGGPGLVERIRLAPYARVAIQIGIATGGAIALGDQLSGSRFYWALIAAWITFFGANTAGEQLRKASLRIIGTLFGVIVGALLAHLVGDRVGLQIAVVLVSLFLGLYLLRVNYAFMVMGVTGAGVAVVRGARRFLQQPACAAA